MSNDRIESSREPEAKSDRALRELFAHAAPRLAPPEADAAEIRAAVFAEWDSLTRRRQLWRRIGLGLAATLAVAAVVLVASMQEPAVLPVVAQVERVQGPVRAEGGELLRVGSAVAEGTTIVTGAGQVALRLESGASLRLAPLTRITFGADNAAELESGAVYFDSERDGAAGQPLTLRTRFGTVRDVGTQFMARIEPARLEVGVRDGSVLLTRGAERAAASSGQKLTSAGQGFIRREPVATFGDEWAWAERLAPPFDINGRQLIDFLEWVAAQTGRTLVFVDDDSREAARVTTLKGSIDLEPMPKLTAVLALTDLGYSIDGERLVIGPK